MPIPLGILAVAGAGANGASYELIETVYPSGSATTITFSSIPQTYKHLQLRMTVRHSDAATSILEECSVRFNSISTNVYSIHWMQGTESASSSGAYATQNSMWGVWTASPNATSNVYAGTIMDILDYASTSKYKTLRSFSGGNPATNSRITLYSGSFQDTTAVSSVSIISPSVSKPFTTASRFSLYGIKG